MLRAYSTNYDQGSVMLQNELTTENRSDSLAVPKPILWWGKFLQFLSKDLATSFVARLFATPQNFPAPERELVMRKSAKNETLYIPALDANVQVYVYGYSRIKVLLVHGWAGRGTQLYHLADKILENQMMVVSFDAPAHGLSEGKRTNMIEYLAVIREIDKKYGPFEAAVGHSFGGMALLNAVADHLNVAKLVTIGADNSIPDIFRYYVQKMQLKPVIAEKLEGLFFDKYRIPVRRLSSESQAERIKIPTLVIHDSDDRYVDVSSAVAIRLKLRQGTLLVTSGLGHHRIFKDPEVIARIISFIR